MDVGIHTLQNMQERFKENMIGYIKGILVDMEEDVVILDHNQMGYRIFVPGKDMANLPGIGAEVKLHTYLNVREDALQLFGFLTRDDLRVFKLLITVNGIGPKVALGILSVLSADDLRFAVLADDVKTIEKAPGIGKKTAQKLILELKDKLSLEEAFEMKLQNQQAAALAPSMDNGAKDEAVQALVALGYSSTDSLKAVRQVEVTDSMTVEDILKGALKYISFL